MIAVLAAAAVGAAVTCAVFHPGIMSSDSLWFYEKALRGEIGRTKSPLLSFVWSRILALWQNPFALLIFQNVLFWSGLALIAAATRLGPAGSAVAVLAIGLFPSVFGLLGTLWSDVLLGACLTFATGLTLLGMRRRSRLWLALAAVPLALSPSARVNAVAAVPPLAAWLTASWIDAGGSPRRIGWRTRAAVSAMVFMGLVAASKIFDRAVIEPDAAPSSRALQFSIYQDLAGIAVRTGDLRLPARVHRAVPHMSLEVIRDLYDPAAINRLLDVRWRNSILTKDPGEFRELVRIWRGAVAAHPLAYLEGRAAAAAAILQISIIYYPFHVGISPNRLGLAFVHTPLYDGVVDGLRATRGIFFRGWVFALLALLVVLQGTRARRWSAVAVSASGLSYVAPYLLVATGGDFRYVWWLVLAALVGALLLAFDRGSE
jgi:hypothetical protein